MVLVDTSVWVNFLRGGDARLRELLDEAEVACHPFVIGELACGHVRNRQAFLSLLQALPQGPVADQNEFLRFIQINALAGSGIGFVDVHLLASSCLSDTPLWASDRRLRGVAAELGIGFG